MNIKSLLYTFLFIVLLGCDPQLPPYDMPYLPFDDIVVNTTLPTYDNLWYDGGYVTLGGGVKGIILYRESATRYHAFEKNCPFDSNSACSTVDVDISQLFMTDPCCGSNFSFPNGEPMGGPSAYPMRKYAVYLNGSFLTITDEIVN